MEFQHSNISQEDKERIERLNAEDKAREEQEEKEGAIKRLNLPLRFEDSNFHNFNGDIQPTAHAVAKGFVEEYKQVQRYHKGIYFYGLAGSGKTHLAAAIANTLLMQTKPMFVSVPELLLQIKKTFNRNTSDDYFDKLSNARLLILDDLGSEKPTEWVQETLFVLIDRRYVKYLPTVITSNLSLDELKDRIGYRIASRIAEMSEVVEMKGVDYRIRKNNDKNKIQASESG